LDVIDGDKEHLVLLLVSREHLGRAIAVIFVCPRPRVGKDVAVGHLQVEVSRYHRDGDEPDTHLQESEFKLSPTDLSIGLPNPDSCYQLIVPKYAQPDEEETIKVSVSIGTVAVMTRS
jgi:E3 ubiquitin-protein ligase SIAH1